MSFRVSSPVPGDAGIGRRDASWIIACSREMASFWGPSGRCDSSSWNFSSSSRNRVELGLPSTSITSFFWSGSSPWVGGAATSLGNTTWPYAPKHAAPNAAFRPPRTVGKENVKAIKGQEIKEEVQCHVDDPQEPVFGARRAGAKRGPHLRRGVRAACQRQGQQRTRVRPPAGERRAEGWAVRDHGSVGRLQARGGRRHLR